MKPEFPEPVGIASSDYKHVVAERDMLRAELNETLELLALRDEQIDIQRQKLLKVAQLQSQLDNMRYEVEFLQNELDEQRQKAGGQLQREMEMMAELQLTDGKIRQYGSVAEQVASLQTQVKLLQQESDELAALNNELLGELKQVAQLQSSLSMERQENRILRERLTDLEKRLDIKPGFLGT